MNPIILGVSDTIDTDIDDYHSLSNEKKYFSLLGESIDKLLSFLKLDPSEFQSIITDYVSIEAAALGREGYGQAVRDANDLGFTGIQCHIVDLGGASVAGALGEAYRIASTNPEAIVLVAGADIPKSAFKQVSDLKRLTKTVAHPEWELPYGATLIGMYSMLANKIMQDNNISQETFDRITKVFRNYAYQNPRAFSYLKEITDKQLTKFLSPPYSSPMIAIVTDHGFATLVVGEIAYNRLVEKKTIHPPKNKVYINGASHAIHSEWFSLKGKLESPAEQAGLRVFGMAGKTPTEVEYAWIYDCFTGMIISQASSYFGIERKKMAESLAKGKVFTGKSEIPINLGGGILNYQAAMSMSGATGLVDTMSQYGLAVQPIPINLDSPPTLSLLGNNGGIDSINSVVLFSTSPSNSIPKKDQAGSLGWKQSTTAKQKLSLNNRKKFEEKFAKAPSEKEPAVDFSGKLLSFCKIAFNPGGERKPPYTLGLVEDDNGDFLMVDLQTKDGKPFLETNRLIIGKTKILTQREDGFWIGIVGD